MYLKYESPFFRSRFNCIFVAIKGTKFDMIWMSTWILTVCESCWCGFHFSNEADLIRFQQNYASLLCSQIHILALILMKCFPPSWCRRTTRPGGGGSSETWWALTVAGWRDYRPPPGTGVTTKLAKTMGMLPQHCILWYYHHIKSINCIYDCDWRPLLLMPKFLWLLKLWELFGLGFLCKLLFYCLQLPFTNLISIFQFERMPKCISVLKSSKITNSSVSDI